MEIQMKLGSFKSNIRQVVVGTIAAALIVACTSAATATPPPDPAPLSTLLPTSTAAPQETATAAAIATPTAVPPVPTATPVPTTGEINSVFIQLTDPLDEPQFYCVDVPGAGGAVRLESPLQAHTCKPLETAEDELFAFDFPNAGQIYMEAYDLCAEASGSSAGAAVFMRPCSDVPSQFFMVADGEIRSAGDEGNELCLAVDPGDGIPTGGPSHLRRDLTLESCSSIRPELSSWIFGIFVY